MTVNFASSSAMVANTSVASFGLNLPVFLTSLSISVAVSLVGG
jgi:hypothetical protein